MGKSEEKICWAVDALENCHSVCTKVFADICTETLLMQVNDGSRRQQACLKTFMEMEKMTEELHILTKEQDVKAEIQAECEDFTRDEHDDTSESPVEESKQ
ncbi:hypothetical protein chiPu_0008689 [Chiloscyllium punctatum]|uniref:Uncharacterized protein n=1 Tax=Chiloscyllium punctatum TaxID=137246 RepID=A0A401SIN0_CHIPU|nr:hypothetical protein [Chiloscyllium punctatum]